MHLIERMATTHFNPFNVLLAFLDFAKQNNSTILRNKFSHDFIRYIDWFADFRTMQKRIHIQNPARHHRGAFSENSQWLSAVKYFR